MVTQIQLESGVAGDLALEAEMMGAADSFSLSLKSPSLDLSLSVRLLGPVSITEPAPSEMKTKEARGTGTISINCDIQLISVNKMEE